MDVQGVVSSVCLGVLCAVALSCCWHASGKTHRKSQPALPLPLPPPPPRSWQLEVRDEDVEAACRLVHEAREVWQPLPVIVCGAAKGRMRSAHALRRYVRALRYQAARRRQRGCGAWQRPRAVLVLPGRAACESEAGQALIHGAAQLGVLVVWMPCAAPQAAVADRMVPLLGL